MIRLNSIFRYAKVKNYGYFSSIEFECEKCGHKYDELQLKLAVFLHGVFFLFGKDTNYGGFTCPFCSHTMIMEGDQASFNSFKDRLSTFISDEFDISLNYFSSIRHAPTAVPALSEFKIPSWQTVIATDETEVLDMEIAAYLDENPLEKETYLCSYLRGWKQAIGSFFSVWWFKNNDIPRLLEIESSDARIKVFPRYVYPWSSDDVEELCWKYHLIEDSFNHLKDRWEKPDRDEVSENEAQNIQLLLDGMRLNQADKISAAADFLNILTAEPPDWDVTDFVASDYDREPFLKKFSIKRLLKEFQYAKVREFVLDHCDRDYTNKFLLEQYPGFIKDYIGLAGRNDVCYISIWRLRLDYLTRLYDHMKKEFLSECRYAFFEEPPTWTIIYNGKTYRGLKGAGFKYIHWLVKKRPDICTTYQLFALDAAPVPVHKSAFENGEDLIDVQTPDDDRMDTSYIKKLVNQKKELLDIIELAEDTGDIDRKESAEQELVFILSQLKKDTGKRGKSRQFSNPKLRNMKRIAKSIERSLAKIKELDPEMYRHFHESLRPIETYNMRYNPPENIDWKIE